MSSDVSGLPLPARGSVYVSPNADAVTMAPALVPT